MPQPGAERSDVAPIRPSALVPADTRLIYLDLNHWIGLAKANTGHRDGARMRAALEALRVRSTGWTYVISMPLIMELTGIRRRGQRAHLGDIIEEFTNFACVMPLTTIAALEFESALAALVPITPRFAPVRLVGQGVMQACGMRGDLRVRDADGADVTERARRGAPVGPEEFDRRLEEAELELNRAVLRGPIDEGEERQLVADGWDPSVAYSVAERRARQEREQADRLSGEPVRRLDHADDCKASERRLGMEAQRHL